MDNNNTEIKFPVKFDLKVIMDCIDDNSHHETRLRNILDKFNIPHKDWDTKVTSSNKYIRYSVNIHLEDKEKMDRLYNELKQVPNIRFAL